MRGSTLTGYAQVLEWLPGLVVCARWFCSPLNKNAAARVGCAFIFVPIFIARRRFFHAQSIATATNASMLACPYAGELKAGLLRTDTSIVYWS